MKDDPLNRLKVKRGSELPWAKLTEEDVIAIRQLISYREGLKRQLSELTDRKIAEKFEIHLRTLEKLKHGETWGHV